MISKRNQHLILSALFIALGFVFPLMFHLIGLGKLLLPMFWPLSVCGFFLPVQYAILVGMLTPLFSFLLSGMPPVPILQVMMIELSVLSITVSLLHHKTSFGTFWIILFGMILSRLAFVSIAGVIAPIMGLPPSLYIISRLTAGLPGSLAILGLMPLVMTRLISRPIFQIRKTHVTKASTLF